MCKISIIITAYNSEVYLEKCLDSIYNQTYKDFEIILINDGSTDHTQQICEKYASTHNNLTLISQINAGIAKARNVGLNASKGEYITFADSDDYVDNNWLASYIEAQEQSNADLIVEGIIVNYPNYENKVSPSHHEFQGKEIIAAYTILKEKCIEGFTVNKLYKSTIIKKNNLHFEYKLKEDLLFNLRYLFYINSITIIPTYCYHYVQHGFQSLTHKRYSAEFMKILITSLYEAGMNLCEKCNASQSKNPIIEEYMLSFSVLLFSMYQKKTGIQNRAERIKYIREYQQIRRSHQNIKIRTGSKAKQLFAKFMMLPPSMTDFFLNRIKL